MGQKVMPLGFRIGIREPWRSRWLASKKDFPLLLEQDQRIRRFIKKEFRSAAVARIDIERTRESTTVIIHTARPGVLIGRKGVRAEQLRKDLAQLAGHPVTVHTVEISRPELSGQLVAESVAEQLQRRAGRCAGGEDPHRRASGRSGHVPPGAGHPGLHRPGHAGCGDRLRVRRSAHHPRRDRRQVLDLPRFLRGHKGSDQRWP